VADLASDWVGAGVARLLRARGHRVTLCVNTAAPGEVLQQYVRDQQLRDLAKDRVEVLTLTRLFGVDDDTAYLEHVLSGERILVSPISALVTAGWRTPNSALANELDALEIPYVALGDCLAPRTVEEAVLEAFTFARQIAAEQT
jgi:NADPH-dependent 2,4-dienoyl-CoA reductase/sulfur reductase-like enzyme